MIAIRFLCASFLLLSSVAQESSPEGLEQIPDFQDDFEANTPVDPSKIGMNLAEKDVTHDFKQVNSALRGVRRGSVEDSFIFEPNGIESLQDGGDGDDSGGDDGTGGDDNFEEQEILEEVKGILDKVKDAVKDEDADIDTIAGAMRRIQNKTDELEAKEDELEGEELEALQNALEKLRRAMEILRSILSKIVNNGGTDDELETLCVLIDEIQDRILDIIFASELDILSSAVEILEELKDFLKGNNEPGEKVDKIDLICKQLEEKIKELKSQLDELEDKIDDLKDDISEEELEALRKKLELLKEALETLFNRKEGNRHIKAILGDIRDAVIDDEYLGELLEELCDKIEDLVIIDEMVNGETDDFVSAEAEKALLKGILDEVKEELKALGSDDGEKANAIASALKRICKRIKELQKMKDELKDDKAASKELKDSLDNLEKAKKILKKIQVSDEGSIGTGIKELCDLIDKNLIAAGDFGDEDELTELESLRRLLNGTKSTLEDALASDDVTVGPSLTAVLADLKAIREKIKELKKKETATKELEAAKKALLKKLKDAEKLLDSIRKKFKTRKANQNEINRLCKVIEKIEERIGEIEEENEGEGGGDD